ncbi:MAG: glycosyltransferase family 2 protein [Bacteroidia bacterium]|jgi:glycosyltransferase involved in cell wall biosynthesis
MLPLVSICIPAYNQPEKLVFLLNSIRNQSFTSYEVIVSDDSNNDSVEVLCKEFKDLNIKYLRNTIAKGTPENWNHAIDAACGSWIKIMHHDDYFYDTEALGNFVAFAEKNPKAEFIFCLTSILYYPSNHRTPYKVDQKLLDAIDQNPAYLFHQNIIGSPSVTFFRKSDFIRFDTNLKWLVDIEYYHRIADKKSIGRIDKMLVETIASDTQLTQYMQGNPEFELTEFFYCYHKFYGESNRLNKKIWNMRMFDLMRTYSISDSKQITRFLNGLSMPFTLSMYFLIFKLNKRLANSIAFRLNKFNLRD